MKNMLPVLQCWREKGSAQFIWSDTAVIVKLSGLFLFEHFMLFGGCSLSGSIYTWLQTTSLHFQKAVLHRAVFKDTARMFTMSTRGRWLFRGLVLLSSFFLLNKHISRWNLFTVRSNAQQYSWVMTINLCKPRQTRIISFFFTEAAMPVRHGFGLTDNTMFCTGAHAARQADRQTSKYTYDHRSCMCSANFILNLVCIHGNVGGC